MLRHTDFLTMAAHTMGVSSIDYRAHGCHHEYRRAGVQAVQPIISGTIPVALSGNSPQPATRIRLMPMSPRPSSGSPTYPLDMFAALTPDHKYLNVAVVNATEPEQKFDLDVTGVPCWPGRPRLWQMTGNSLDGANHVGQPRRSR